jgi:glycosyltransferase involved in cell wall biosynthesis
MLFLSCKNSFILFRGFMFSIIIPTMQKDLDVLNKLLAQLNDDDSVGEILVIDNSCNGFKTDLSKVIVHFQKENLFVNPAWNLGIKLSSDKYDFFGILNDDIIFQKNLFRAVEEFFEQADNKVGLAGIDCANNTPKEKFNSYPENTAVKFVKLDKLSGFWGSAYFGKKSNYFEIPNEIKVFYGDHFLFRRNQQAGRQNYSITNISVKHLESLTSHSSSFIKKLFKSDRKYCIKHDGVEHQNLSFMQRVFSITYYHEHYVLCMLGLKMKFRAHK